MAEQDLAIDVGQASVEIVSRVVWESLAPAFLDYNYRQTWQYGLALAGLRGAVSEHVAIRSGNEVIGLADVRIRRLPLIGGGLAFISGGPLTRRGSMNDTKCLSNSLDALWCEYVRKRRMTLQIVPPIGPAAAAGELADVVVASGFNAVDRPPFNRTFLLDIGRDEAEIRKGMAQNWRNCLNSSQRQNLSVETGTDSFLFARFNELLESLIARKRFWVELDGPFYSAVQRDTSQADKLIVGLVSSGEQLHAGGVFGMHGDTCVYLLGATSEEGLRTKASYLLQWSIIQKARSRGLRWYDLGGIDSQGNPGVYHFKKGLGGVDVAVQSFERQDNRVRSGLIQRAERLYNWKRGHMAHKRLTTFGQ